MTQTAMLEAKEVEQYFKVLVLNCLERELGNDNRPLQREVVVLVPNMERGEAQKVDMKGAVPEAEIQALNLKVAMRDLRKRLSSDKSLIYCIYKVCELI